MALQKFEKYDAEHQRLWDSMQIIRDANTLHRQAEKVKQFQSVYEAVEKDTGVPWQLVAVIHIREAGMGDVGKFQRGIHNGQSWRIKATIIPKIGPFKSWHECALAALKRTGLSNVARGTWTPAKMLSAAEPYNGYGYRNKGIRSPYLWASTNHQQRGKYVRDGVFDRNVMDTQVGVAAQLKYLGVGAKKTSVPIVVGTGAGAAATAVVATTWYQQIWQWVLAHPYGTAGFILGTAGLIYLLLKSRKKTENVGNNQNTLPVGKETVG